MIALDQMTGGGLEPTDVVPLLTSRANSDPMLRETADWIVAQHPEWGDSLVDYFREELAGLSAEAAGESSSSFQQSLQQRLTRFASNPAARELFVEVLRGADFNAIAKITVLRVMGDSGGKTMPAEWVAEMLPLLRSGETTVMQEVVTALRRVPASDENSKGLVEQLLAAGRDSRQPDELRLAALAAVPGTSAVMCTCCC